jgi:hypothetical protein
MCIILPVSHIPCTHTVAIWQHCVEASRTGPDGPQPCWNIKQHEQGIITRSLCGDCSGQRFFARRGGVAERGKGSPVTTPEINAKLNDEEDADDSGYHSDVIHEEEEDSDRAESPLSPRSMSPPMMTCRQRKRSLSNQRSLNHKQSWRPNLKRDLTLENDLLPQNRSDSIDFFLNRLDDSLHATELQTGHMEASTSNIDSQTPSTPTGLTKRMRDSTLFHPVSPLPAETTCHAQVAKAFPFPQMIEIRSPSPPRIRKNSTLLHPSSPFQDAPTAANTAPLMSPSPSNATRRPAQLTRRPSSLLHPSKSDPVPIAAQYKTILSVPPRKLTAPIIPLRRMPPLHTTQSDPQSATMARQRRASVLHSCLSDDEDEDDVGRWVGSDEDEAEGAMLENSARAARASRWGVGWE